MRTRKAFVIAGFWAFLVVVAVHFLQFPGSGPDFNRASGGGVLLDASPAFTPDGIYERLDGYGETGRQNYSFRNVTVDVLLPMSVFPFLFLLIRRVVARFRLARSCEPCSSPCRSSMWRLIFSKTRPFWLSWPTTQNA